MIDAATIKQAATGRWREILQSLGGCPAEVLDGKHHPCPKCGGKDRFRLLDAAVGALYCNQCFNTNNGDGLSAISWLRGWQFKQTVAELGNYLAVNGDGDGRVGGDGRPRINKSPKTYPTAREAVASLDSRVSKTDQGWRVAWWTYTDVEGNPVAVVVRYDLPTPEGEKQRKTFRPVSKHGDGWRCSDPPGRWPLYRLPELVTAEVVYVCEGEKAVDAAKLIGLTATTSSHGSKSAGKADWSVLTGKQISIIPDHDDDGEHYAADVAEIVIALKPPATVKIVRLPGLPAAGDIVDWIEGHGDTAEPGELRRQIEALGDTTPLEPGKNIGSVAVATTIKGADKPIRPRPSAPAILPWKPFPVDALPEPVRGFVTTGAKAIGCDPSYIALPILTALAAAIGNTRCIQLKRRWNAPAILWAAIVGESGTAKTPAFRLVMRPIRERQRKALERHAEAMSEYEADLAHYEKRLAEWKRDKKTTDEPPTKPDPPQAERCVVSDTTLEALAPLLLANPRGLLLACDELAGWIGSFDRYVGGKGGADAAHWKSMHNAESIVVDRKTGSLRMIYVPRASVSVCGGIQPAILHRALGIEHRESGLAARLLLTCPPRQPKRWTEADIDPAVEAQIARLVERLYELHPDYGEDRKPRPVVVGLTPQAKRVWKAYYNAHAQEQVNLAGELSAAWSKLEGYAARLALVIHFARWAADDPDLRDVDAVDAESMAAGITLVEWFKQEAQRVYALLSESDDDRDRRRLVESVQSKGGSMTPRDLMRSSRRYGTATEAENALADLVRVGIGHWDTISPPASGGHATRIFRLSRGADTDTRPIIPEEKGSSVGVGAVSAAENIEPIDASLAVAATDDPDKWLVL